MAWKRDLGVPLLMSSAYDYGRLFVGAMDMRVYALDSKTGEIVWKSDRLYGAALKDYWPVVYKDHMLIRPAKVSGASTGPAIEWFPGPLPPTELDKQTKMIAGFQQNPESQAFCNRVVENQPHWYVTYAEAILSAEMGFNMPSDAYGQFLAMAWILGENPGQLRCYLDVPWLPVGDFYYLHKVAVIVRAFRAE